MAFGGLLALVITGFLAMGLLAAANAGLELTVQGAVLLFSVIAVIGFAVWILGKNADRKNKIAPKLNDFLESTHALEN
jgi:predicted lipid-binding transport protein (Tim44 family)